MLLACLALIAKARIEQDMSLFLEGFHESVQERTGPVTKDCLDYHGIVLFNHISHSVRLFDLEKAETTTDAYLSVIHNIEKDGQKAVQDCSHYVRNDIEVLVEDLGHLQEEVDFKTTMMSQIEQGEQTDQTAYDYISESITALKANDWKAIGSYLGEVMKIVALHEQRFPVRYSYK